MWSTRYLVLIIRRKAPIEFNQVMICALPVQESVTVITGHENARKSSKDAKRWPQDRSHLSSGMSRCGGDGDEMNTYRGMSGN